MHRVGGRLLVGNALGQRVRWNVPHPPRGDAVRIQRQLAVVLDGQRRLRQDDAAEGQRDGWDSQKLYHALSLYRRRARAVRARGG